MKSNVLDAIKGIYGQSVAFISKRAATTPTRNQVCYMIGFPNNTVRLVKLASCTQSAVVVYTKACQSEIAELKQKGIPCYSLDKVSEFKQAIQHITQSRVVVADNYFACLADIAFSESQTVYQVWHATGAIKKFGLEDPKTKLRSMKDQKRFSNVYQQFDYVVVASDEMGDIFCRSYGLNPNRILPYGFFRTDALFDQKKQKDNDKQRIVLYLPTYRLSGDLDSWFLDVKRVSQSLKPSDELWIKVHPHMKNEQINLPNVIWIDESQSAETLILQSDVLITDYSSVAFDFTLIHPDKPLILYWPDREVYQVETGIHDEIETHLSSPVCHTVEDVLQQLSQSNPVDHTDFNRIWNTYNDGKATERLLDEINRTMDGEKWKNQ